MSFPFIHSYPQIVLKTRRVQNCNFPSAKFYISNRWPRCDFPMRYIGRKHVSTIPNKLLHIMQTPLLVLSDAFHSKMERTPVPFVIWFLHECNPFDISPDDIAYTTDSLPSIGLSGDYTSYFFREVFVFMTWMDYIFTGGTR